MILRWFFNLKCLLNALTLKNNYIFLSFFFSLSTTAHLHSKEDQCRDAAVSASKYLAQQCSNSQDVKDVLQHFFDILNGKVYLLLLFYLYLIIWFLFCACYLNFIFNLSIKKKSDRTKLIYYIKYYIIYYINILFPGKKSYKWYINFLFPL